MPTLNITIQQRNELRAAAHALRPVVQIGDKGLSDAVFKEIEVHLDAHQLIKVRVSGDDREHRLAIFKEMCERLNAEPIHHIGKVLTIYRRNDARQPVITAPEPATRATRKPNEPYTPKKLAAAGISKGKRGSPRSSPDEEFKPRPATTPSRPAPAKPTAAKRSAAQRRTTGSALSLRAGARRGR
ncbi:YhbY family RNA-binding protein [Paenalcaligenes niemegkensis]|uniref:YhbY family RNA-binding protein n=1 Tax=Paenalcaligenes niemegkensis TaxID=2895469 RepID=UPI001EE92BE2|nr:YhbY family RNA-binding protein [Paenalcaligenes niemegkensis]MCQ9615810.1 YhbY family RNA-binding protein [Paenalcaligenes niemegkensis]